MLLALCLRSVVSLGPVLGLTPSATWQAPEMAAEPYAQLYAEASAELAQGNSDRARVLFEAALSRAPKNAGCAYSIACCVLAQGERRAALRWLGRAVDWGFVDADLCEWDSDLEALHADSEVHRLLGRMRHGLEARLDEGPPDIAIWHASPAWASHPRLSFDGTRALTREGALWDLESGEVVALLFPDPARPATHAVFSPRGGFAAIADRGRRVRLYDPRNGALLIELEGRAYPSYPLAFSADETRLAAASLEGRTKVWDLLRKQLVASLETSGDAPARLSPAGNRALTLGTARAALWDVDRGESLWVHEAPRRASWAGDFDAEGALCYVLALDSGLITVLESDHGAELTHIASDDSRFTAACFQPRERALVSGDEAGWLEIWDATSGTPRGRFHAHEGAIRWVVASPAGDLLVSFGDDEFVRAWEPSFGELLWEEARSGGIARLLPPSFDGSARQLALPGIDESFELRDPFDGSEIVRHRYPVLRAVDAAFDSSGDRTFVLASDGSLRIIDTESGDTLQVIGGLGPRAARIAVDPTGKRIATAARGPELCLIDAADGRVIARPSAFDGDMGTPELSFSADGRFLLTTGRGRRAGLFDAATGEHLRWFDDHEYSIEHGAWSHQGARFALADAGHRVRVIEAESGEDVCPPLDHLSGVRCLEFTPAGDRLLTGTEGGTANLYELESGDLLRTFGPSPPSLGPWIVDAEFRADGRVLVTGTGERGRLTAWDVPGGRALWSVDLSTGAPLSLRLRFDSDGSRLFVAAEFDNGARIVSARTGRTITMLGSSIGGLSLSPDGERLLALGSGSTRLFDAARGLATYRRIELDHGGHLSLTPSGHCSGSIASMRRAHVLLDGESVPLDALAPELFDPKRLRASRAGVVIAPPAPMHPPTLRLAGAPHVPLQRSDEGALRISGLARDPVAVLAVEVRRDGVLLGRARPDTPKGSDVQRYEFVVELEDPGAGVLEVRAIGAGGLASRVAYVHP